ncbi:MAG TPA: 3D domain-containing protein, partial [Azospirillaceae bacterium]|nr:3D domain-containing protein [Azospirillaceae bacterium]
WIDLDGTPLPGGKLQRLMLAQDTGGAIKGAVRGDVFWGHGPLAAEAAGFMKGRGKKWLLALRPNRAQYLSQLP